VRKALFLFGISFLLLGLVSGALIQSYWQTANVKISGQPEDPLEAWSEVDVIVWQYNSTFYASRNMSTLMVIELLSNATEVLTNVIGNVSATQGSIFVRNGTYTASVTLKTNVWLTLDKGASGITVTINAGATATLEDRNAGRIRCWKAGVLAWDSNLDSGSLTTANAVFSSWMNSTSIDGDNYYLGNQSLGFVGPATFIIDVSGSTYRAWHGANSTLFTSGTNASQVINNALENLTVGRTWMETVYLKGNFTISNTILVSSYTHIILDGMVSLDGASHISILQNAHPTVYDGHVIIEGGVWDGGADISWHGGHGINWTGTTSALYNNREIWIRNLKLQNCIVDGLHLEGNGGSYPYIFHVSEVDANGYRYGLYVYGIGDTQFVGGHWGSDTSIAIYITGAGPLQFSTFQTDGSIIIFESKEVTMGTFTLDVTNRNVSGLDLKGCRGSQFSNGYIKTSASNAYVTFAAITLNKTGTAFYQVSTNNLFSNIRIGRPVEGTGTDRWKYGVYETESSTYIDYNTFIGMDCYDSVTAGIILGGINSHANLSWNQTSWLT